MFMCQECGHKIRTAAKAERICNEGCPKCGGTDVDLDETHPIWVSRKLQTAQEMSGRYDEPSWDSLHREGF